MTFAFIDRLRQPEYTGSNRCLPCTGVNLVIALVASGVAALLALSVFDLLPAVLVGTAIFLGCVAAIALRGYLVPGTPELTQRYLPASILRWFDKDVPSTESEEIDIEARLWRAGAIEECEDVQDLCLTADFHEDWTDRMRKLQGDNTGRDDLASIFEVDPEHLSFDTYGEAFVGYLEGRKVGQWESHAAYLADMAAVDPLQSRLEDWPSIEIGERGALLRGLRVFLDACPSCNGDVTIDHNVVKSCCHSTDVTTLSCQDCGARLFEAKQPG